MVRRGQCAGMAKEFTDEEARKNIRILQPVTATPEQEHEMGTE